MATDHKAIMSLADIDEDTIVEIARLCKVDASGIQDVYEPSPLQTASLAATSKATDDSGSEAHQYTITLGTATDLGQFCHALRQVVEANSILRTRIVQCRRGLLQVVLRESHHTARYPETDDDDEWLAVLRKERAYPMGLNRALFRSALVGTRLVLTLHHAVFDQWTSMAMMADVEELLHHRTPKPRAQFRDFVSYCRSIDQERAKAFWTEQFKHPVVVWPVVEPAHVSSATRIVEKEIVFTGDAVNISPPLIPSFIEAAWILTAKAYTQADSVLYGFVFSDRSGAHENFRTTLGPTIANVPVQATLPETVRELLKMRTQARRKLQTHPALQYGATNISSCSAEARAACGFQTLLNIRATEVDVADSDTGRFRSIESVPAPYALVLECGVHHGGAAVRARFDPETIRQEQMERIMHQLEHYLQHLVSADGQTRLDALPLMNEHDRHEILSWNSTAWNDSAEHCLHELFAQQACKMPSAVAVEAHDGRVTYAELDRMSTRFAHELQRSGVGPETPVLLVFEKSMWAIVGVLSVLKAGGTCVPCDPAYPIARTKAVYDLVKAGLILTSDDARHALQHEFGGRVLAVTAQAVSDAPGTKSMLPTCSPSQAAYIMATSGTSGAPKGVTLEHRNLVSSLSAFSKVLGVQPGSRMLHFASLVWDVSFMETIGSLIAGCMVCIPSEVDRESDLAGFIDSSKVDAAILTPTVMNTLAPDRVPRLKVLCSGGEPILPDAVTTWASRLRLINGWGLTETALCSTAAVLTPESSYPDSIGNPVGCAVWIVDPTDLHTLVPIGAVGELVVEGPGVARGYVSNERLSADSFVSDPPAWTCSRKTTHRFFRTGDMAKYNSDGSICFIGRRDSCVKLRGQRFELGEVERVLDGNCCVHEAFAVVMGHELTAVISIMQSKKVALEALRLLPDADQQAVLAGIIKVVEQQVPSYMVPTAWFVVESMPRSIAHKMDRKRIKEWLSEQDFTAAKKRAQAGDKSQSAASSAMELMLRSIWSTVLNVPEISIFRETSFMKLGGDSILAMQVAARCRQEGVLIRVVTLLRSTSLAAAALQCKRQGDTLVDSPLESKATLPDADGRWIQSASPEEQVDFDAVGLASKDVQCVIPCSPIQEGIILHEMRAGRTDQAWNCIVLELTSKGKDHVIDVDQLVQTWDAVCAANDILRTVFASGVDGALHQVVLKQTKPRILRLTAGDFHGIEDYETGETAAGDPPHCMTLARKAGTVRMRLDISHALVDPFTLSRLFEQLLSGYRDLAAIVPGPSMTEYVARTLSRRATALQHWTAQLQGCHPCLLPSAGEGEAEEAGHKHCRIPFHGTSRLSAFCRQYEVTTASVVQVAWGCVLRVLTSLPEPIFGCIVDERDWLGGDAGTALGPLLGMTICQVKLSDKTAISDVLSTVSEDSATGLEHASFSLSELHDALGLKASPLFNTALSFVRQLPDKVDWGADAGIGVEPLAIGDNSEYAMMVKAGYSVENFEAWLDYRTSEISSQYASIVAATFATLMDKILEDPTMLVTDLLGTFVEHSAEPDDHAAGLDERRTSSFWPEYLKQMDRAATFPADSDSLLPADTKSQVSKNIIIPVERRDEALLEASVVGAWALSLARITGKNVVCFGRTLTTSEASSLGKVLGTPVPLVLDLAPRSTCNDLTAQTTRTWSEVLAHIRHEGQDPSSLFMSSVLTVAGEALPAEETSRPSDASLSVQCHVAPEYGAIKLSISSNQLYPEQLEVILSQYVHAVTQMTAQADALLSDLARVSQQELSLMQTWQSTNSHGINESMHHRFGQVVARQPGLMAVESWDGKLTYSQLDAMSGQMASRLRAMGVVAESIVPTFCEKSTAAIVAIMAVIKAGGAVMPLDPTHPPDRLVNIVESVGSSLAISSPRYRSLTEALVSCVFCVSIEGCLETAAEDDLADAGVVSEPSAPLYVISTSGSTGAPKAIVVSHANAVTAAIDFIPQLGLSPSTRTIQATNFVFDVAMGDIFFTLLAGGCLCMPSESKLQGGMAETIKEYAANFAFITPTMARLITPTETPTLQTLALIGETVTREAAEIWATSLRLLNTYGPAETTVLTSCNDVSSEGVHTFRDVGRPLSGRYWIVDPDDLDKLCPIGCCGELLIEGPTVAVGYFQDEARTAAAFINPPAWSKAFPTMDSSSRLFRTGDLAKQSPDGSISILGRKDTQVKLHGRRIELGDVEYHLRKYAGADWGVAVEVLAAGREQAELVAFMASLNHTHEDAVEACATSCGLLLEQLPEPAVAIHQAMLTALPEYMVPDIFCHVKRIPCTRVGKTDRRLLRSVADEMSATQLRAYSVRNRSMLRSSQAARPCILSEAQLEMRALWAEVLGLPASAISGTDDFFSIGGNSIRAMRLVAAARRVRISLTLEKVFKSTSLSQMTTAAAEGSASADLIDIAGAAIALTVPGSDLTSIPEAYQDKIECIVPATGLQKLMFGLRPDRSYALSGSADEFVLDFSPDVNVHQLEEALAVVVEHHSALRTVLIHDHSTVYQVVLKTAYLADVSEWAPATMLPRFRLIHDGVRCSAIHWRIHHAFYDNISLKLMLSDLVSVYDRKPLSGGARFDDWAAYVSQLDSTASIQFWSRSLAGSKTMTCLAAPHTLSAADSDMPKMRHTRRVAAKLCRLKDYPGTVATVLKAAWARVLSQTVDQPQHILFAEVTANRNLNIAGVENVRGPCINLLPVKVCVRPDSNVASLVSELQEQAEEALPHHHVDFSSMIGNIESGLGSIVVFQDRGHADVSGRIGGSEFRLSGKSQIGGLADVWVVAWCEDNWLMVEIDCSERIPEEKARQLVSLLEAALA